jgi:EAL domain-containing protein (putative c-di-GMP-specific phosphodiesterase class I)
VPLGEWVLRRACDDATSWPEGVKVAVNLSPVQFKQADLFDIIQSALQSSGLQPRRLEIELTESVLLERAVENHAFMQKLKSIGISLSLDDFGTVVVELPDRVPVRQDQDRQVVHLQPDQARQRARELA